MALVRDLFVSWCLAGADYELYALSFTKADRFGRSLWCTCAERPPVMLLASNQRPFMEVVCTLVFIARTLLSLDCLAGILKEDVVGRVPKPAKAVTTSQSQLTREKQKTSKHTTA